MSNRSINHLLSKIHKKKSGVSCQAPFKNLLINQQGLFNICCFNNSYVLGKYPEQSIDAIWFGEKRRTITNQFLHHEIPDSCSFCLKSGLHKASYNSNNQHHIEATNNKFKSYPKQIEFLLSNECNLNCVMCAKVISSSSSINRKNKPSSEHVIFDDAFLDQLKPYLKKLNFAVFSGGEPFLIPVYEKMWDFISNNNPLASIYIQTNGTILNKKAKENLATYKLEIGVSIDAVSKSTYEKIRRNAHFETTMENLNYFIQHMRSLNKTLTLMVTPMTLNADEIPEIVEFCNEKDINFSLSILEWPMNLAIWSLPSIEMDKIPAKYKSFCFATNTKSTISIKNIQSFHHFTELVEKYAQRKMYFETNEHIILDSILQKSIAIADNFELSIQKNLEKLNLDAEEKNKIQERATKLIKQFFEQFSPRFANKFYFYSFFIKREIGVYIDHILVYNDALLEEIMDEKIAELLLAFNTKSFDRIIDIDVGI